MPKMEPVNERQMRLILDAIPARIWFMDRLHRIVFANREAAQLYGAEPADIVGMHSAEVIGQAGFDFDLPKRERALAGEIYRWEGWSVYSDDEQRYTQRIYHPHIDRRGKTTGYYEFVRDVTDLKNAEADQRFWAQLLQDAVNSLSDGFGVLDTDERLQVCNPPFAEFYGEPVETLLGRNVADRFPHLVDRLSAVDGKPFDRDAPDALDQFNAYRRGHMEPIELAMRDGQTYSARRANTSDGARVVMLTNVTELKRREEEAALAHRLLEDAIESLALGFAIFDADDRLTMCNQPYRDNHGVCADILEPGVTWTEIIRQSAARGLYPGVGDDVEGYVKARMAERKAPDASPEHQLSDGRWLRIWYQRTHLGGTVVTQTDITERRRMEEDLRRSEELVRRVLEACPAPVTMSRAVDGSIIYENPASLQILKHGDTPPETAADRWLDPEDRAAFVRQLRETGKVEELEGEFRKADGTTFWCSLSARLIDYQGERVVVTSVFDLTERRAAEAELARQREALHQSEKLGALGELLAGVSHELNNPLSVLVGQAAMLSEAAPDEATRKRAEKISEAADRCSRIVKSFLAMARQQPSMLTPIDLNDSISKALEVTAYALRTADITIDFRRMSGDVLVRGDADQIGQVWTNLIVNAQHALEGVRGPRRLTIVSRRLPDGRNAKVTFADNGPGIPEKVRSRIFEPLFTTKDVGAGTGIGLALCHRIVRAHGGTITVEPSSLGGAAFSITLPIAKAASGSISMVRLPARGEGGYRVLVVDDEADVRRTIEECLLHDGHIVDQASSGSEALAKLRAASYDVILSDIRMADLDGPSLHRALEADHPELVNRLAFISGDTLSANVRAFLNQVDRPYLEKPVHPKEVRSLVLDVARGRLN